MHTNPGCVCVFMLPGTDGFIIIIIARWMDTIPDAVRVRTGSAYIYIALSSSLGASSRLTVLVVLYNGSKFAHIRWSAGIGTFGSFVFV